MTQYEEYLQMKNRGIDADGETALATRNISVATARKCGISNDGPLILFPLGYQTPLPDRFKAINPSTKGQFFSDKSPLLADDEEYHAPFFNQQDFMDKESITITEGEWDCLSWMELGYSNIVSIPNGANCVKGLFNHWYKWVTSFKKVYINFDNDTAGRKAVEEVKAILPKERVFVVYTPEKDMNDALKRGITCEEVDGLLSNAQRYHPSGVVHISEISLDDVLKATPKGLRTHYPLFDKILGGLRSGELTCIVGDTGVGKTSFGLQLVHKVVNDKHTCWLSSQEMSKEKLLKKVYGMQIAHTIFDEETILSEGEKAHLRTWIKKAPLYVDPDAPAMSLVSVAENLSYLKNVYGVKVVLIEDIGYLQSTAKGSNAAEKFEDAMKQLHAYAVNLNIHILLVCHLKQTENDKGEVFMSQIKGSSAIKQYADNIVAVQRMDRVDKSEKWMGIVKVTILKNRNFGEEGTVLFKYFKEKGVYEECLKNSN